VLVAVGGACNEISDYMAQLYDSSNP
jgi:hypothetical protein